MANNLAASFPEYWSRRMQITRSKTAVYRAITSFEEAKTLAKGDIVRRPYRSSLVVNTMGSEGSYTRQDITDTDDYLEIDQEKEITFYVRDVDALQSNYKTANLYADDAGNRSGEYIDGQILGEYDQATSTVDDGDLGGTDDNGLTLTISNVLKTLIQAKKKLTALDIPLNNRWGVISSEFEAILTEYLSGKESQLGDSTGKNGHIGRYQGFDLFVSNNLCWSGSLVTSATLANGDTFTIAGVTWTLVTDASNAAAGEIDLGSTNDLTVANIIAAVNNAEGTAANTQSATAEYWELTAANRKIITKNGIVASDGGTYDSVAIKAYGASVVAVSEVIVDATDIWTTTAQIQHQLFGQGKSIDAVIQKYPHMEFKDRTGYIGKDFVNWFVMGIKTFHEGCDHLVDVMIRTDAF